MDNGSNKLFLVSGHCWKKSDAFVHLWGEKMPQHELWSEHFFYFFMFLCQTPWVLFPAYIKYQTKVGCFTFWSYKQESDMRSSWLLDAISALWYRNCCVCSWDLSMVLEHSAYGILVKRQTSWFTTRVLSPYPTCTSVLDLSEVTVQFDTLSVLDRRSFAVAILQGREGDSTNSTPFRAMQYNIQSMHEVHYVRYIMVYQVYDLDFMKAGEEFNIIKCHQFHKLMVKKEEKSLIGRCCHLKVNVKMCSTAHIWLFFSTNKWEMCCCSSIQLDVLALNLNPLSVHILQSQYITEGVDRVSREEQATFIFLKENRKVKEFKLSLYSSVS